MAGRFFVSARIKGCKEMNPIKKCVNHVTYFKNCVMLIN